MPTTRVRRTLAAEPAAVWKLLSDPYHLVRWWPRVQRVEGVEGAAPGDRFTQVLGTARGKGVRADFRVVERVERERLSWAQELAGSPFERLLQEAVTAFTLAPEQSGGTTVAIELRQRLRGWSRLTPFLFRRAARRQLGEALDRLEETV